MHALGEPAAGAALRQVIGELALTGWLRPQELRALSGSLQTATVPQIEAWLSVGIAVTGVKKRPAAVAP